MLNHTKLVMQGTVRILFYVSDARCITTHDAQGPNPNTSVSPYQPMLLWVLISDSKRFSIHSPLLKIDEGWLTSAIGLHSCSASNVKNWKGPGRICTLPFHYCTTEQPLRFCDCQMIMRYLCCIERHRHQSKLPSFAGCWHLAKDCMDAAIIL